MPSRTVLVTGATGLLGREVCKAFRLDSSNWTVKGTAYSRADGVDIIKADLGDEGRVKSVLDEIKPDVIVHCAAQRFPNKVDEDPDAARALNIEASASLARLAAARDILLIYISTDYVFPGVPGDAPYEADAEPRPTNLYGQTKLDGERAVLREYEAAGRQGLGVALRVPVLYGHAETPGESAVNVLMDSLWKAQTEGAKIKMDHWAIRYPTNTEDVGRVCHDIAEKYLSTSPDTRKSLPQILQFTSEDKVTKYEIVERFADIMGLPLTGIEPDTKGNDPNAAVQRPYDSHLSTKALRDLGINVSTMNFTDWWRREVKAFRH